MQEENNTGFSNKTLIQLGVGILVGVVFLIIISIMILKKSSESVDIVTANLSIAQKTVMDIQKNASIAQKNIEVVQASPSAPQTTNICICPKCGATGTPSCIYCKMMMQWNPIQSAFRCPNCQRTAMPYCPNCRLPMQLKDVPAPHAQQV